MVRDKNQINPGHKNTQKNQLEDLNSSSMKGPNTGLKKPRF